MSQPHVLRGETKKIPAMRITCEPDCWVLEEGKTVQKGKLAGKLRWRQTKFYPRLGDLFTEYYEIHARASDRPLVEAIQDAKRVVAEAVSRLLPQSTEVA